VPHKFGYIKPSRTGEQHPPVFFRVGVSLIGNVENMESNFAMKRRQTQEDASAESARKRSLQAYAIFLDRADFQMFAVSQEEDALRREEAGLFSLREIRYVTR
jgi:hypothetical protein